MRLEGILEPVRYDVADRVVGEVSCRAGVEMHGLQGRASVPTRSVETPCWNMSHAADTMIFDAKHCCPTIGECGLPPRGIRPLGHARTRALRRHLHDRSNGGPGRWSIAVNSSF